jgi:hypothetical protein
MITPSPTPILYDGIKIHVFTDYLVVIEGQSGSIYLYNKDLTQIQRYESTERNVSGFVIGEYIGVLKVGGEIFVEKLNSHTVDFINSQSVRTGQLLVNNNLNVYKEMNVRGNTTFGSGIFVSGDSVFVGDLVVGDDNFVRGCLETKCLTTALPDDTMIITAGSSSLNLSTESVLIDSPLTTISGNLVVSGVISFNGLDYTDCYSNVRCYSDPSILLYGDTDLIATAGIIEVTNRITTNVTLGQPITFTIEFSGDYEISYRYNYNAISPLEDAIVNMSLVINDDGASGLFYQSTLVTNFVHAGPFENYFQNYSIITPLAVNDVIRPHISVSGSLDIKINNYSITLKRLGKDAY